MLGTLQPNNHQQQNHQQHQQPQQQHQQPQQGQIPPPPPQNGQDFTLSSVLHYLQTEWRRYERDRNEWEIERAEMRVRLSLAPLTLFSWLFIAIWQARIALLEGERRSFENVKLDLMRRIKMLEYALRMERSVYSFFLHDFSPHNYLKIQATYSTNLQLYSFHKVPHHSSKCSSFISKR